MHGLLASPPLFQVAWGLALQFVFALCILRWDVGREVIACLGDKTNTFLGYTDDGSSFTFGYLVHRRPFIPALLPENSTARAVAAQVNAARAVPGVVVFKALSVIYFFSFIVNILFYYGAIQRLTQWIGWDGRKQPNRLQFRCFIATSIWRLTYL